MASLTGINIGLFVVFVICATLFVSERSTCVHDAAVGAVGLHPPRHVPSVPAARRRTGQRLVAQQTASRPTCRASAAASGPVLRLHSAPGSAERSTCRASAAASGPAPRLSSAPGSTPAAGRPSRKRRRQEVIRFCDTRLLLFYH